MAFATPESRTRDVLQKFTNELASLRDIGITDFALLNFVVRAQEGHSRNEAVRELLEGRTLTQQERDLVLAMLQRLVPE